MLVWPLAQAAGGKVQGVGEFAQGLKFKASTSIHPYTGGGQANKSKNTVAVGPLKSYTNVFKPQLLIKPKYPSPNSQHIPSPN